MNKDTYMEYLKGKIYSLYHHFENNENDVKDKIDLLISYYQKELEIKNAELEAKIYAYEKIIANSNFAPILKENKKSKNESKGE